MENNVSQPDVKDEAQPEENKQKPTCGIIMPIAPIDGLQSDHWVDVFSLLTEVAEKEGFITSMVSESDDSGIIHQRIIQNIYNNDIVICDVSAKNPNVMFELGMRLAFDKPTILIKDDSTDYVFDTGLIEHIPYPRDLRFNKIVGFKTLLGKKLKATYNNSKKSDYSTFLGHFSNFKVQKLKEKEGDINTLVLDSLQELRLEFLNLRHSNNVKKHTPSLPELISEIISQFTEMTGSTKTAIFIDEGLTVDLEKFAIDYLRKRRVNIDRKHLKDLLEAEVMPF